MIEQACREMDLDPARSVMVGDRWTRRRVRAGRRHARGAGPHGPRRVAKPMRAARRRARRCYPQQFDGGSRVDSAKLLSLDRGDGEPDGRRDRRRRGRRVRVRARRARLARGAGADPRVRLHGDRARAAAATPPTTSAALGGRANLVGVVGRDEPGRRLLGVAARARRSARARPAAGAQHAGQDAHPRRRHSLGQAAGRAHRSRASATPFDRDATRRRSSAARWRPR